MISAIWRAVLLGVSVAAPIGPVNLAVIRTVLVRGPKPAWLLGIGTAVVDTAYLLFTYVGLTLLLLRIAWIPPVLGLAGSFILARMVWCALAAASRGKAHDLLKSAQTKGPPGGEGRGARQGGPPGSPRERFRNRA